MRCLSLPIMAVIAISLGGCLPSEEPSSKTNLRNEIFRLQVEASHGINRARMAQILNNIEIDMKIAVVDQKISRNQEKDIQDFVNYGRRILFEWETDLGCHKFSPYVKRSCLEGIYKKVKELGGDDRQIDAWRKIDEEAQAKAAAELPGKLAEITKSYSNHSVGQDDFTKRAINNAEKEYIKLAVDRAKEEHTDVVAITDNDVIGYLISLLYGRTFGAVEAITGSKSST